MAADLSAPCWYVAVRAAGSTTEVRVDGDRREPGQVTALTFEDSEKKADKLTLKVNNYDLSQTDSPVWQPGNTVVFQFGYPGAMSPVREMKIQKIKGIPLLEVECLGDEVMLNRHPRTDLRWEQTKRSDVVREIARRYGYAEDRIHVADTAEVIPQISQAGLTDLKLIRALAIREGYEFYVDFDGLHFHPRNLKQEPIRTLTYFTDPGRGDIESISTDDDRAPGKPGGVSLKGRDPMNKETFEVKGDDASTEGRTTLAPERTAVATFEEIDPVTLETRTVARQPPPPPAAGQLGAVAQDDVRLTTEQTKTTAQRAASGMFGQQQMRAITMQFTCRGDGNLLAKSIIRIEGLGSRRSGLYYVISAKYEVGAGFKMTIKCRRDGLANARAEAGFPSTTAKTSAPQNPAASAETPPANTAPALREVEVIDPVTLRTTTILVPAGRSPAA